MTPDEQARALFDALDCLDAASDRCAELEDEVACLQALLLAALGARGSVPFMPVCDYRRESESVTMNPAM